MAPLNELPKENDWYCFNSFSLRPFLVNKTVFFTKESVSICFHWLKPPWASIDFETISLAVIFFLSQKRNELATKTKQVVLKKKTSNVKGHHERLLLSYLYIYNKG